MKTSFNIGQELEVQKDRVEIVRIEICKECLEGFDYGIREVGEDYDGGVVGSTVGGDWLVKHLEGEMG